MKTLLEVKNLSVEAKSKKLSVKLVDNISFSLKEGECLGILGESGSGKSMTCKAIMGLLDKNFQIEGSAIYENNDLLKKNSEDMRKLRGKEIAMVLQNPMTCFDPLYPIGYQMAETFTEHLNLNQEEIKKKSIEILELMQLKNTEDILHKYPHQLSGGMLQRIMIGLAMAMEPKLLIADEPTTAIDAVTQYEIIKEFIKIKEKYKVAIIFISHDLSVISKIADNVIVMSNGKAVAQGDKNYIFSSEKEEYTKMLIEKKMAVMNRYKEILHNGRRKVYAAGS
ncbi:ABC transporter ATP-binding protein [uncultured Fusobacterium sp.]|uniref:ABC transporter ATP-binding protein n=1 Tax=uncultured Fusobacterium sp. TaxID=159267 RepID=UPI000BBAEB01|nr:ABC transporter ATP-binding protein [uncultured Fusobacterium sp.]BBA49927.1 putative ABC transporter ATP-binding protein [Fusobacterium varium]